MSNEIKSAQKAFDKLLEYRQKDDAKRKATLIEKAKSIQLAKRHCRYF